MLQLTQRSPQPGLAFGRSKEINPLRLRILALRSQHLNLVARIKTLAERHEFMVDLSCNAMAADLRMQVKRHIQHRCINRKRQQLPFRSENHNLRCKQVQLECVKEIKSIRLRIIQYILDCMKPHVQFALLVPFPDLIFPMRGKSLLGNLIHPLRAYLHLNPVPVGPHHRQMQCLVAVSLRIGNPVARAVRMQPVDVGNRRIYLPAYPLLLARIIAFKHYSRRIQVIHLLKRYMLALHLVPDGIDRFNPRLSLIFKPHRIELLNHRRGEIAVNSLALRRRGLNLLADTFERVRMLIFETEVLKLCLNLKQPQAVRKRCVDIQSLTRNLILFVRRHRPKSAHVVQTVGHLDQHNPDILRHGEQQLAEILRLCRSLVAENTPRYFRKPLNQLRNLLSEILLYILNGILRILHYIVEQSCTDRCRT